MKIAINTRFLLKNKLEGIGWYTYEITRRMVLAHPETQFYFLFDRPFSNEFIFASNVTPVVLKPPARHPLLFYIWFEYSVNKFLKRHNIDAFFSPDGFLPLRTQTPSYITIHDIAHVHFPQHHSLMVRNYYNYFMPRFVRKARHIFTVSKYSMDDIVHAYTIDPQKISFIYNGCREIYKPIDSEKQEEVRRRYTQDNPFFLYIGSIHPRKNMERVLKAFKFLIQQEEQQSHKLVIVGRMAWKASSVQKLMDDPLISKNLIWLGNLEDKELVKILGSSSALVYPSLFEGFGIPIVEALNCHIPVITSNTSSMPEVGGDGAYYVDPYSVDSIYNGMKRIIQDKNLRSKLIEHGKEQIHKFDWDKTAKKIYFRITNDQDV